MSTEMTPQDLEARQAYQRKVQAELDNINASITEYRAKVDQTAADASAEFNSQVESLLVKRDAAEAKLKQLQDASSDAWADVQSGFESAWKELESAFSQAAAKIENSING